MNIVRLTASAAALSLCLVPLAGAHAQTAGEKSGSAYVQCDGQPNNVTGAETAARLIGAVTLLGLFAPPPEAPDASKRKSGETGVAVCSSLIDGEKKEGNPHRRFGLILARAIHQIEAKKYEAALADVLLARQEATAAGLSNDAYWLRSRGRALGQVESAALLRMGRTTEAQAVALRDAGSVEYSLFGLFDTPVYDDLLRSPTNEEDRIHHWRSRLLPSLSKDRADRLELAGRFGEAARVRDALVEFDAENSPELNSSAPFALAAVTHALAGNAPVAAERAAAARANADKRKSVGKPEDNAAEFVELMDLYAILESARSGDAKTARRLFSARSQWVAASLGSVLEVNRRLREGAPADDLIGGLARTGDQLWQEHSDTKRTELLAKDSDNKTLFRLLPAMRAAASYETISRNVWRTDKSRIVLSTKVDPAKTKMELMFMSMVDPMAAMEGYVLHAALLAKSRGHQGFVFQPLVADKIIAATFRTGNKGEKGLPDDLFIPAEDVIAKLSPIIPDPAKLKARRAAAR